MEPYKLRFFCDYGGGCLWSANDRAICEFGVMVDSDSLPISKKLKEEIKKLEHEFQTSIDWNNPSVLQWNDLQKQEFMEKETEIYNKLCSALGNDFEIKRETSLR